jgi:hypothetical protein
MTFQLTLACQYFNYFPNGDALLLILPPQFVVNTDDHPGADEILEFHLTGLLLGTTSFLLSWFHEIPSK